jgi:hypothetical protein
MFPRDPWFAAGAVLRALVVGFALAATASTLAAPALAADAAVESDLGERVRARFDVDALRDGLLLRPTAPGGAVRSIELADDGEVLVNGKPFDEAELSSFLGADGALMVKLVGLDPEDRRRELGLARAEAAADSADEESEGVHTTVAVDVPGLPGVRVSGSKEDRISVGRSIELEAGDSARDVVCIGCSVEIGGATRGDAVAVGGSVHVLAGGVVGGSTVSVGGSTDIDAGAVVEGDAVAVGGSVEVEPGGEVQGQRSSVGWGGRMFGSHDGGWLPFGFATNAGGLFWSIFRTVFLALLVWLVLLVARPAVATAERRVVAEPWKAVFAGLLTQLLFLPVLVLVTVILAVSIIGIPLLVLVPVALVALVIGALVGFAAVAAVAGRALERRFGSHLASPFLVALLGVTAIQLVSIVGRLVGLPGGVLGFFGFALLAAGFCIKYAAWTLGLGAMTLVALGRDWRRPAPTVVAAEPERELETEPETKVSEPARDPD